MSSPLAKRGLYAVDFCRTCGAEHPAGNINTHAQGCWQCAGRVEDAELYEAIQRARSMDGVLQGEEQCKMVLATPEVP